MPFSLSLIVFAFICFYWNNRLRLLRTCSTEMECMATELNKKRQRLLEPGRDHDAWEAEMAGILAVPAWSTLCWGIANALFFVFLSVPLIYAGYSFECDG
ncbi:hypothetical protein BT93_L5258 [Corymbia citriodora subsp. variegata]|uniref:Uncharacterized protein n=1 Tax=Corymbia citriodora subsp. variegata TaxID=360336 RepID=A0A8T0CF59_CORYI|nr:hypothetical protein BT93_L5258 [Corymbia citriodora subsp. variegata]